MSVARPMLSWPHSMPLEPRVVTIAAPDDEQAEEQHGDRRADEHLDVTLAAFGGHLGSFGRFAEPLAIVSRPSVNGSGELRHPLANGRSRPATTGGAGCFDATAS